MQSSLGLYLRQLRKSRKLSQAQVTQKAGISRITLNRWERDVQRPRLTELEALLTALGEEPQRAFFLLGRPGISRYIPLSGEKSGIDSHAVSRLGPTPHGGEMLWALRMRQGLTQEQACRKMGMGLRTLRRWEKGDVWPSPSQLEGLCEALNAAPEEKIALTQGEFILESSNEGASIEELYQQCQQLRPSVQSDGVIVCRELRLFALEARAWPLALKSVEGQRLLTGIYACHANYYSSHQRYAESGLYAHKALDILPSNFVPDQETIHAAIISASAAVYRRSIPAPQYGIEILRHWLDAAHWPDLNAWILSDLAKYLVLQGHQEESLNLARNARKMALKSGKLYEEYMRELDEAEILLASRKPAQALALLERDIAVLEPQHKAKFWLFEAQACLCLGLLSRAHDRVQDANTLIETWELEYLRSQSQKLTRQL